MTTITDEIQRALRSNNIISGEEVALLSGDLYLAENVLTKERRLIPDSQINLYISMNTIQESTTKSQLLKG